MNNNEILEYNKRCAEFMGYKVIDEPLVIDGLIVWNKSTHPSFPDNTVVVSNLFYHSDFNYLIPVIRKIEEHGYVVAIKGISYQVYKVLDEQNPIVSLVCGDLSKKTEMTCDLIASFIEKLNQN